MNDDNVILEAKAPPLTANRVRCLGCATIIESTHLHDRSTCECGQVSVDGGLDHPRVLYRPGARYERLGPV